MSKSININRPGNPQFVIAPVDDNEAVVALIRLRDTGNLLVETSDTGYLHYLSREALGPAYVTMTEAPSSTGPVCGESIPS